MTDKELEPPKIKCKDCGEDNPAEIHTCSPQFIPCPECGEPTTLNHGYVTNIETNWRTCFNCDWQGEPE